MTYIQTSSRPSRSISPVIAALHDYGLRVIARYKRYRRLKIARLAFQNLLRYDDHILQDMGYTREELRSANRLPLDVNAARVVHETRQMLRQK